jgi:hypothetical protein
MTLSKKQLKAREPIYELKRQARREESVPKEEGWKCAFYDKFSSTLLWKKDDEVIEVPSIWYNLNVEQTLASNRASLEGAKRRVEKWKEEAAKPMKAVDAKRIYTPKEHAESELRESEWVVKYYEHQIAQLEKLPQDKLITTVVLERLEKPRYF